MSANTAAGALSRFLNSTPDTASAGALMERLGGVLREFGDDGLDLSRAIDMSGLSKADFLTVLTNGQSTGVLDVFEDGGVSKIRLGPVGKSLF